MAKLRAERSRLPASLFYMQTSTQYRKFAEECDQLAQQAQSERHRKMLEDMAKVWRKLATEADAKDPERPR